MPILVWNASSSSPEGLYLVTPAASLELHQLAIAWPPRRARDLAARRHYLPVNVPLVKRVAAVPGDRVCARGAKVRINGRLAAVRRSVDRRGRALPRWEGCLRLQRGQVLLLGSVGANSFDGRYFGLTRRAEIIGKAKFLWPR